MGKTNFISLSKKDFFDVRNAVQTAALGHCIPEYPNVPNKPLLLSRVITKGLFDAKELDEKNTF